MATQRYIIVHDHGTEVHLNWTRMSMAYEALLIAGLHPRLLSKDEQL